MARTYKRDARGRFAGGGGGSGGGRKSAKLPAPTKRTASGKTKRQGLLTQRAAVSAAQAKLKSKDPADRSLTGQLSLRAQKAAVTRAKNKLAAAQKTGRIRLSGRDGVIRPRKGGAKKVGASIGRNAKVPTNLPGINDDRWKWNKGGTALATMPERRKQFARERQREKNYLLADKQRAGKVRAERRALRFTLSGRDSREYSSTNYAARAALKRKSARAEEVFKGQRRPRRMSQKQAAKLAKRRANSERVARAAMAEYARQSQYVEGRTIRRRRY